MFIHIPDGLGLVFDRRGARCQTAPPDGTHHLARRRARRRGVRPRRHAHRRRQRGEVAGRRRGPRPRHPVRPGARGPPPLWRGALWSRRRRRQGVAVHLGPRRERPSATSWPCPKCSPQRTCARRSALRWPAASPSTSTQGTAWSSSRPPRRCTWHASPRRSARTAPRRPTSRRSAGGSPGATRGRTVGARRSSARSRAPRVARHRPHRPGSPALRLRQLARGPPAARSGGPARRRLAARSARPALEVPATRRRAHHQHPDVIVGVRRQPSVAPGQSSKRRPESCSYART